MLMATSSSWQTQRGHQAHRPQRQASLHDRSAASTPTNASHGASGERGLSSVAGNAWLGGDRPHRSGSTLGVAEDQHVPVRGFNAQETKEMLRRGRFILRLGLDLTRASIHGMQQFRFSTQSVCWQGQH